MGKIAPCLCTAFVVLHIGCANVYVRASSLAPVTRLLVALKAHNAGLIDSLFLWSFSVAIHTAKSYNAKKHHIKSLISLQLAIICNCNYKYITAITTIAYISVITTYDNFHKVSWFYFCSPITGIVNFCSISQEGGFTMHIGSKLYHYITRRVDIYTLLVPIDILKSIYWNHIIPQLCPTHK